MRTKKEIEKRIESLQEEIDSYTTDGSGGQSALYDDSFTQITTELHALKWVLGMNWEEICDEQNERSTKILGY